MLGATISRKVSLDPIPGGRIWVALTQPSSKVLWGKLYPGLSAPWLCRQGCK